MGLAKCSKVLRPFSHLRGLVFLFCLLVGSGFSQVPWVGGALQVLYLAPSQPTLESLVSIPGFEAIQRKYHFLERWKQSVSFFSVQQNLFPGVFETLVQQPVVFFWYTPGSEEHLLALSLGETLLLETFLDVTSGALQNGGVIFPFFPGVEQWVKALHPNTVSARVRDFVLFSTNQEFLDMASSAIKFRQDFPESTLFFLESGGEVVEGKNAFHFLLVETRRQATRAVSPLPAGLLEKVQAQKSPFDVVGSWHAWSGDVAFAEMQRTVEVFGSNEEWNRFGAAACERSEWVQMESKGEEWLLVFWMKDPLPFFAPFSEQWGLEKKELPNVVFSWNGVPGLHATPLSDRLLLSNVSDVVQKSLFGVDPEMLEEMASSLETGNPFSWEFASPGDGQLPLSLFRWKTVENGIEKRSLRIF